MVADHGRKRLNGPSIAGCSSLEQHRIKKKRLESPKNDVNAKSLISLKWDGSRKKVVAKREQIGISQRVLRPFIDSFPHHHKILADSFALPKEIYQLENLEEVLSYETWQTLLSEKERNDLMQFLPAGSNAEEVVEALLAGGNFNFGNPFLKWGSSLCLGNLHPDAVLCREQSLKADKKAYNLEIQKYHHDMIKYLQKVKNTWENIKDPEKDFLQKIWRSRRKAETKMPSIATETRFHNPRERVSATSESCSLVGEETTCSSDDQNSSAMKGRELPTRIYEKSFMKDACRKPLTASDDARSRKGEKLRKQNLNRSDDTKYMSYVKISKEQHRLVKSMKQSGKSIQSKSLNCVLGDIDTLRVQPYEHFVKEEQKKLQDHWLQLANKDLPAAYAKWRERQLWMRNLTWSLEHDMKCNKNSPTEERENHETAFQERERDNHEGVALDQERQNHEGALLNQERENHESALLDEVRVNPENASHGELRVDYESALQHQTDEMDVDNSNNETLLQEQTDQEARNHESNVELRDEESNDKTLENLTAQVTRNKEYNSEDSVQDEEHHKATLLDQGDDVIRNNKYSLEDDKDSFPGSQQYNSACQLSSNSNGHDLIDMNSGLNHVQFNGPDHIDVNSGLNHVQFKSHDASPDTSDYSRNANAVDASIHQGVPSSSGRDVWSAVTMPNSYYDSSAHQEYTSTSGSLLPNQVSGEHRTQLIDLESDMPEEDLGKNLLHRHSSDGSFSSYPNHDRGGFPLPKQVSGEHRTQLIDLDSDMTEEDLGKNLLHKQSDGTFSSYPNYDRSGWLLQSVFKGHGMLPYYQGQKQNGRDFQSQSNVMMEGGQFNGDLQGHLRVDQVHKGHENNYMPQNISQGIYPEGGGYLIPRQGHVPPVNLQDWNVNPVRMPAPHQASLNMDGLLTQNWFPGDHQVRGDWLSAGGATIPSQSIGDQSLFSVLPNCNQLRPSGPFDSIGSTEAFMVSRNYGMVSVVAPRMSHALPQTGQPLDYLSGRDTNSSLMPDDLGWVNLPQNSALHDPMEKPYLRSWNQ